MATLRLCRKIYSRAAIERAGEAFSELVRVTTRVKGGYHEVRLEPRTSTGEDVDDGLVKEFANYVLYATLLLRRA